MSTRESCVLTLTNVPDCEPVQFGTCTLPRSFFKMTPVKTVVEKLAIVVDNFEEKEAKTVPTKTVVPVAQFRDDNTSDSDKWYQGLSTNTNLVWPGCRCLQDSSSV
jgi:hypothetical protein